MTPGSLASVSPRLVARDAASVVRLVPVQGLALGALPGVEVREEAKASGSVAVGANVRVTSEHVERERRQQQDPRVRGCKQRLGTERAHEDTASGAGSVTSVKSGSSPTVTRGTV